MTYAMHYSPRVKGWGYYDPTASHTIRNRPLCRTRGRLEVTNDREKVTCGACRSKMPAPAAKPDDK